MTDKTEAERHARGNPEQAAKELRESEQRAAVYQMALRVYTKEPCRICGRLLTMDDIRAGAVFAGYSDDNSSRGAHKRCWAGMVDVATAFRRQAHGGRRMTYRVEIKRHDTGLWQDADDREFVHPRYAREYAGDAYDSFRWRVVDENGTVHADSVTRRGPAPGGRR